jgi:acyl phosphate:glycerol-3-phosphate acyltransferase
MIAGLFVLFGAYVVGAIPFGWMIARAKGIDIFKAGSGNIGATNVGRVLGKKWGVAVFACDFSKGALPVALASLYAKDFDAAVGYGDCLRVGSAILAFLGHMFPFLLRFRGGKGVATGAGAAFVLLPMPAAIAILVWLALASSSKMVSLASIVAAVAFCVVRLLSISTPFGSEHLVVTLFCLFVTAMSIWKHRGNVVRILRGTENKLESAMWEVLCRTLHVLSLGVWFGSALMFNFIAAPTIFESFKDVVENAPSDRTAYQELAPSSDAEKKKQLASALAGSAVGPIFPKFFALQAICATVALFTAFAWRSNGGLGKWRMIVVALACITVAIGWPLSEKVTALRIQRFTDEAAKAAFGEWHLYSLGLSTLTILLTGIALAMAGSISNAKRLA